MPSHPDDDERLLGRLQAGDQHRTRGILRTKSRTTPPDGPATARPSPARADVNNGETAAVLGIHKAAASQHVRALRLKEIRSPAIGMLDDSDMSHAEEVDG